MKTYTEILFTHKKSMLVQFDTPVPLNVVHKSFYNEQTFRKALLRLSMLGYFNKVVSTGDRECYKDNHIEIHV